MGTGNGAASLPGAPLAGQAGQPVGKCQACASVLT
jgi:hypothetical protein